MNIDNPGGLPPWRDDDDDDENDGEEWKTNPKKIIVKNLYEQWCEVYSILRGVFEIVKPETEEAISAEMLESQKQMCLGDAHIIGAKIHGAEVGNSYTIRMQNAAIIRHLAAGINTMTYGLFIKDLSAEKELKILRESIKKFRMLFIEWVASFKKDEFEDEWGLFI